ncbi:MAG TPA: hypothetical protein VGG56_08570 [Terracidiphilus sp.]|jgi:hypothetical protein
MRNFAITIMLAVFGACCYSQSAVPKADQQDAPEIAARKAVLVDLDTRKKNLIAQSDDMASIAKSLNGFDFNNAMSISDHAQHGMIYLDAVYWFVGTYDRMQCVEDKNAAKAVLQDRLSFYALMLDMAVDRTNGRLGLTRVPAVAQQGQRIRDELRAAKNKLDEIAASLK